MGIVYAEALENVVLHLGGRCGREGNDGSPPNLLNHGAYASVLGAKVMPPLRYAVGFVDGIEGDLDTLEPLNVLVLGERLWGHIEHLGHAAHHVAFHIVYGGSAKRRVEEVGHAIVL